MYLSLSRPDQSHRNTKDVNLTGKILKPLVGLRALVALACVLAAISATALLSPPTRFVTCCAVALTPGPFGPASFPMRSWRNW